MATGEEDEMNAMDFTDLELRLQEHADRAERVSRRAWMLEPAAAPCRTSVTELFAATVRRGSLVAAAALTAVGALVLAAH
ncbi:MAG: hypothetical protein M3Y88_03145 [Chloroflexota bacterium]|nr:hypothetical protein [Chloroflexota bacterium]